MSASLLELMEDLLQSIEQREAGDPDAPAWEATARIRRLEEELARRLNVADQPGTVATGGHARPAEEPAAAL
jgi:hypothetical protein